MAVRRFRKGTYNRYFKRKMRARGRFSRRRTTFKARVNRVLMKKTETKHFDIGLEDHQLYHNLGSGVGAVPPTTVTSIQTWFNPWEYIQQGTNRQSRIGDKITPTGMSIKMYFANKVDRPNTMLRLIVALMPKTIQGSVTGTAQFPFQIPNLFSLGNNMLMPADGDKGIKFLYDRILRFPQNVLYGGYNPIKEPTKVVKLWIKRKKSSAIIFDQSTGNIVNRPIAIYAIPYEQFSTPQTANVTSCAGFMRLYYKDI